MNHPEIKAGFVGFGEINTPREIIERKSAEASRLLEGQGIKLVATAPVSDDADGRDVARACQELAREDFDVLVLCVAGWIPSHAVIAVADKFAHKPMILWGLGGWMEGERFVTTADQAGTTALRKTMQDMGYRFKYIVTYMNKPPDVKSVVDFARAASAAARLRGARIGMMGCRDMNLYATLHDGVSLRARIGPEVEFFEMLEITRAMDEISEGEVAELAAELSSSWTFASSPAEGTLENSVRLYLALKRKVAERGYQAVSLKDVDGVKQLLEFAPAAAFMLLTDREKIPTVPENDVMGAVTQLMVRLVTGQIAAYLEFYEFMEGGALMGVPDYVPSEVVDGPVTVRPTSFGGFGEGLLNVSKLKTGEVTICRLSHTGNNYSMHMRTGLARTPRAWEEAGWQPPAPQLPGLEIVLKGSVEDFVQGVTGQHYILSYGDNTGPIGDLCRLLGVEIN
jgi:L-fucose isomerase-like protein